MGNPREETGSDDPKERSRSGQSRDGVSGPHRVAAIARRSPAGDGAARRPLAGLLSPGPALGDCRRCLVALSLDGCAPSHGVGALQRYVGVGIAARDDLTLARGTRGSARWPHGRLACLLVFTSSVS